MNEKIQIEASPLSEMPNKKKVYQTPVLVSYGDVRDVTLGPTGGTGESGCAALFRPGPGFGPGGPPPECDLFP